VYGLATDGAYVYFTRGKYGTSCTYSNRPGLYRIPVDGGLKETVWHDSTCVSNPADLRLDGNYLYFLDRGTNQVRRVVKDGGTPTNLNSATLSAAYFTRRISTDSSYVYWLDNNGLWKKNKDGSGSATSIVMSGVNTTNTNMIDAYNGIVYAATNDGMRGTDGFFCNDSVNIRAQTLYGSSVYWVRQGGYVAYHPIGGGTNCTSVYVDTYTFFGSDVTGTGLAKPSSITVATLRNPTDNWVMEKAANGTVTYVNGVTQTNAHAVVATTTHAYWATFEGIRRSAL
jgi:hypothetical protein